MLKLENALTEINWVIVGLSDVRRSGERTIKRVYKETVDKVEAS